MAHGPDGLVEASQALLESDNYDMAAVSGVIEKGDPILHQLGCTSSSFVDETARNLASLLPQLQTVQDLLAANWLVVGYKGMKIEESFTLDTLRREQVNTHLDGLASSSRRIEAGVQLSFCLEGAREFYSERLPDTFYTEDGKFDIGGYRNLTHPRSELSRELRAGRMPRTGAELNAGDVGMFPHHPVVSLHKTTHLKSGTSARLITYFAIEEKPTI